MLRAMAATAAGSAFAARSIGQGRCRDGYATRGCPMTAELATAAIKPVFAATGWKTVALDHIAFDVADYRKEAAFYMALMGFQLRSDDGKQAILDIAPWGSVIFREAAGQPSAAVRNLCFAIEPWNTRSVRAELEKRGLNPVAENGDKGFESFRVQDPDGGSLQIANSNGLVKARKTPPSATLAQPAPFEPTGWKTIWLDHFSYDVTDYKKSASFYSNLLGWKETYDEGSQHELLIGDIGDIIFRGGNPKDPNFGKSATQRKPRIDHISFGISPWDTDGVKSELEKRGLSARIDTSTKDEIHVAPYKSYHTGTPNGYNLQMSYVTRATRLALSNAVKPKPA
jgi:catechol 2,3-dioxygenase-like lactoylglutathione lyase family enzyme